jgi:predicted ATPase
MFLKILSHPVFLNLNFHMPMVVDLSHPLVMLSGENGSGKSTLLHSIHYALRGEKGGRLRYKLDRGGVKRARYFCSTRSSTIRACRWTCSKISRTCWSFCSWQATAR